MHLKLKRQGGHAAGLIAILVVCVASVVYFAFSNSEEFKQKKMEKHQTACHMGCDGVFFPQERVAQALGYYQDTRLVFNGSLVLVKQKTMCYTGYVGKILTDTSLCEKGLHRIKGCPIQQAVPQIDRFNGRRVDEGVDFYFPKGEFSMEKMVACVDRFLEVNRDRLIGRWTMSQ